MENIKGLISFLWTGKRDPDYSRVDNTNLSAIASRFRGSKEDTVFVTTSQLCPTCSIYNRRIYSLFGRQKQFPLLPRFLQQKKCPTCSVCIGYAHYFPEMSKNLKKDISSSNRPFVDSRTLEEKKLWNERIAKAEFDQKVQRDYKWICNNLPELAPKSIGGYKRMINANSAAYKKIVSSALTKGYII